MNQYKYIYGPVPSWRLGSSLGIDLLSQKEKICNFDCVYCQLGPTKKYQAKRKNYIPVKKVIAELISLPGIAIDYITFSGRGEPTLAANLGEAIKAAKCMRKEPVAVLTNSSLIGLAEVRSELSLADFVVAKLDACLPDYLQEINRPQVTIEFGDILRGLADFRKDYKGKLALQIMFMNKNKNEVGKFAYLVNYIKPDEVQINTPLRPCGVKALPREDILKIKEHFICKCNLADVVSVYDDRSFRKIASISDEDTLRRRGKIK